MYLATITRSNKSFDGFEVTHLSVDRAPIKGDLIGLESADGLHGIFAVRQVCFYNSHTYLWLRKLPIELKSYDELQKRRQEEFEKKWGKLKSVEEIGEMVKDVMTALSHKNAQ